MCSLDSVRLTLDSDCPIPLLVWFSLALPMTSASFLPDSDRSIIQTKRLLFVYEFAWICVAILFLNISIQLLPRKWCVSAKPSASGESDLTPGLIRVALGRRSAIAGRIARREERPAAFAAPTVTMALTATAEGGTDVVLYSPPRWRCREGGGAAAAANPIGLKKQEPVLLRTLTAR